MKVVCAWCGTVISEGSGPRVSHGMCSSCRHNPEVLQGKSLEDFADSFSFPVAIMDSSLRPVVINRSAYQNLTNHRRVSEHTTMGAIVECRNSGEPEECGRAVHCTGCVLRSTISKTNETGEAFVDVPAKLSTDAEDVFYYISTRKVDGHVVVKMSKGPAQP